MRHFTTAKFVEGYRSAGQHRIPDYVSIRLMERLTVEGKEEYLCEVREGGNLVLSYLDSNHDDVLRVFFDRVKLYDSRSYNIDQLV